MDKYNFDEIIDRKGTNSLKYDYAVKRGKPADVLPLWVADMDFRTPKEVIDALVQKAQHGIFGYSEPLDGYYDAIVKWFTNHFGWQPNRSKFVLTCGVVFAICNLIDALSEEEDGILINQPVYYPFSEAITDNGRKLVNSNLVYSEGRYSFDFDDIEKKIKEHNVKVFLLCNPHNPVGRVWRMEELKRISEICLRNDVFVISDEIHADFIYSKYSFVSYAALGKEALRKAAICTAPSKTFNLAGLHNANIYIEDDKIRRRYIKLQNKKGYFQSNVMGIVACEAAYRYGGDWLKELQEYLEGNLSFVRNYLARRLPKIKLVEPEGTYLIWLDCRELGIDDERLNEIITYKAKLWLDAGNIFGESGKYFERVNIACPRSVLETAFDRLYNALRSEKII